MTKPQALIVEDNAMNTEVLRTLLETNGLEAVTITSPKEILSVVQQMSNLQVVFLDLEFPNASGFDVNRQLIEMGWDPHIPIVAYSVHTSEVDRVRREGFHSFLGKPVDPLKFTQQLADILAGKRTWSIP